MNEVLLAAAESDPTSWPDVVLILGMFGLIGFIYWCMMKD